MTDRVCTGCGRTTVPCTLWQAADPTTRTAWKAQGLVRYAARGLCPACYLRARNTATLAEHLTQHHQDGVERRRGNCSRCGVHAALSDSLCIDCVHVTNDLHELQRWAS